MGDYNQDGQILIIELRRGPNGFECLELKSFMEGHNIQSLCLIGSNKLMVGVNYDKELKVINASSGELCLTIPRNY